MITKRWSKSSTQAPAIILSSCSCCVVCGDHVECGPYFRIAGQMLSLGISSIYFTPKYWLRIPPPPPTSACNGPANPSTPRLNIAQLVPVVQGLFTAGLAESTHKTYQASGNRYSKFCQQANLTPHTASEEVLLLFITSLYREKLSHSTINSYLAALRYRHGQPSYPFHAPGGVPTEGGVKDTAAHSLTPQPPNLSSGLVGVQSGRIL